MAKKPLPKAAEPFRFKKGVSGNPEGGRAHNPATKALKKLTIETYREVIELVLQGNLDDLQAMIKNPKTTALQVGVAAAFLKAIKNGDYAVVERIAERIVGKIPEEINVNSNNINQNSFSIETMDKTKLRLAMAKLNDEV